MVTRCKKCGKPLGYNKTAWSSIDGMYCSETCGVLDAMTLYDKNEYSNGVELYEKARRYFAEVAEELSREDYGLKAEIIEVYSPHHDITTVFEQVSEGSEIICMTCVGWYYGKDTKIDVQRVLRSGMTAEFVL